MSLYKPNSSVCILFAKALSCESPHLYVLIMPTSGMSEVAEPSTEITEIEEIELKDASDGDNLLTKGVEVDDVLNGIGCGLFQVFAYILAALSFFAFSSRNYLTLAFVFLDISREWGISGVEGSTMAVLSCVGVPIGSVFMGNLSDRFGRVWPYAIYALGIGASVLGSAFAPNFFVFLVLRTLAAIFLGGTQLIVYPTLLEFLPINKRGQIATLVMLNQSIGSSLASLLAWFLIAHYAKIGWRLYIIATAVPCLLLVVYRILFYFESPRYLIGRGRIDKAWSIFEKMARINRKNLDDIATRGNLVVHNNNGLSEGCLQRMKKLSYILRPPLLWHTLCLFVIAPLIRGFIFANSLMFLSIILKNLGVNPYGGLLISNISQIPGLLLMSIITEWPRFGRLNTFRIFTLLAAISYFLFAFIQTEVTIPVFTVFVFFAIAPMTSMLFTYISESYPTDIRATAGSFIDVCSAIGGIVTSLLGGYMSDLSKRFSWLFPTATGTACVVVLFVSIFMRREPSGKKLKDSVEQNN